MSKAADSTQNLRTELQLSKLKWFKKKCALIPQRHPKFKPAACFSEAVLPVLLIIWMSVISQLLTYFCTTINSNKLIQKQIKFHLEDITH